MLLEWNKVQGSRCHGDEGLIGRSASRRTAWGGFPLTRGMDVMSGAKKMSDVLEAQSERTHGGRTVSALYAIQTGAPVLSAGCGTKKRDGWAACKRKCGTDHPFAPGLLANVLVTPRKSARLLPAVVLPVTGAFSVELTALSSRPFVILFTPLPHSDHPTPSIQIRRLSGFWELLTRGMRFEGRLTALSLICGDGRARPGEPSATRSQPLLQSASEAGEVMRDHPQSDTQHIRPGAKGHRHQGMAVSEVAADGSPKGSVDIPLRSDRGKRRAGSRGDHAQSGPGFSNLSSEPGYFQSLKHKESRGKISVSCGKYPTAGLIAQDRFQSEARRDVQSTVYRNNGRGKTHTAVRSLTAISQSGRAAEPDRGPKQRCSDKM
ncbi:hypothetical protein SKAU_G00405480 [Synaphobranchus kaupii]|uniref:Uncharacterized protein n=1 Tax=Synaphobranchus kaupii TaxID=118154 RepID=A0A9Q1E9Y9_SYNKA|nr:hypothetical protein SKAU_G00405480 [Synaphobranchus kaupii]